MIFIAVVIDELIGAVIDVSVDVLTELCIGVVVAAAIALEVFLTGPCVGDVWTGVWSETVLVLGCGLRLPCVWAGEVLPIDIDVTIATWAGVMVGVLIDLLTDTIVDSVTDIGVDMLAGVDAKVDPEFIERVSLADSLRCC